MFEFFHNKKLEGTSGFQFCHSVLTSEKAEQTKNPTALLSREVRSQGKLLPQN
jgi:hypothetical protein